MNDGILKVKNLSVGYGEIPVIQDVSFEAYPGQILCLIGPNGAGKSTLLKSVLGQLSPMAGEIVLGGRSISDMGERELARCSAAVLTTRPEPERTRCDEVVALGRYPYTGWMGTLSPNDRRVVQQSMEQVGIRELSGLDYRELSDGQRQRVMLARAICQEPKLLVLDEPTSFLDIRYKLEFLELLRGLVRERHLTVLMSMHELDLAQKVSDMLLCLKEGKIVCRGRPDEVFSGDIIQRLFNMEKGRFDPVFGSAELPGIQGIPHVFVIGGGGCGIPVYRRLQRLGIPFAVGVLPGNDLDFPIASALAAQVVSCPAFEPVSASAVEEAMSVLAACTAVLCPADRFGSVSCGNQQLLDYAREKGLLLSMDEAERRFAAPTDTDSRGNG